MYYKTEKAYRKKWYNTKNLNFPVSAFSPLALALTAGVAVWRYVKVLEFPPSKQPAKSWGVCVVGYLDAAMWFLAGELCMSPSMDALGVFNVWPHQNL